MGIELGSSAIKVVELEKTNQHFQLVTYGIAKHDRAVVESSAQLNKQHRIDSLRRILNEARVTTHKVVAALPAMNVFHTTIELPLMPDKDMDSAIHWEVKRLVPLPVDKMSIDWHIIPTNNQTEKKSMRVIITAAPKEIINHYMEIFKQANLQLVGLETEINAMRRSLIGEQPGNYLVIDFGATNTNMVIFADQVPMMVRNVEIGGETITMNIVNAMQVTPDRAEQFRNSLGIQTKNDAPHPAARAIQFVIDSMIIKELERFIQTFKNTEHKNIDQVIITGGCAHLKNLPEHLEEILKINVSIGNPWQKIQYAQELEPNLAAIGSEMAVVIGLALKQK